MDLGPMLVLGAAWLIINAMRKAGEKPPGGVEKTPGRPGPLPGAKPPAPRSTTDRPATPSQATAADASRTVTRATLDPTQREGLRLETLLRQLGQTLEEASSGPLGRLADRALPSADEEEETGSLEATPEVQSLETDVARPARAVVDQDDEAERIVAQRLRAADSNLAPRSRTDHQAFDARIRREPADKTAVAPSRSKQLRDAIVWREILGPPVSLRDHDER